MVGTHIVAALALFAGCSRSSPHAAPDASAGPPTVSVDALPKAPLPAAQPFVTAYAIFGKTSANLLFCADITATPPEGAPASWKPNLGAFAPKDPSQVPIERPCGAQFPDRTDASVPLGRPAGRFLSGGAGLAPTARCACGCTPKRAHFWATSRHLLPCKIS